MTVRGNARRLRSLLIKAGRRLASWKRILLIVLVNDRATIPWSTLVERGVDVRITDGGELRIGLGCSLEAGTKIVVQGAAVGIGAYTLVGRGSTIVAQKSITIGTRVLIAEYVTIRDQNHHVDTAGPIIFSGFDLAPIEICDDVWIGAKATILPGSRLGSGSVVGAHALVRTDVPEQAIAVGVPARVMRLRRRGTNE